MRMNKLSTLVATALLLTALAGAAWWVTGRDEARAKTVELQLSGQAAVTLAPEDALQRASEEAGFDIHVPSKLPPGALEMTSISVDKGPPGLPNAMASISIRYIVPGKSQAGGYSLEVLQFAAEIGAPDSAAPLSGTPPGVRAFIERNADGTSFITAFAGGRTYLLLSRGTPQPSEASLTAMAGSFASPK